MSLKKLFSMALCSLACVLPLVTQAASANAERPRIGLVLGGGGARGFAHLGVLEELERLRIPIDCLAGASAGALIGGFYAAGRPVAELQQQFADADWDAMLAGRAARSNVPFTVKRDDFLNYFDFAVGVRDGSLQLPRGAINSQEIDLFIRDLARNVHRDSFDTLPIPFQAMATDLTTGEPVTFRSGDLATALRASMAVPGLFDPVPYGDSLLVDGGLARQLPIQNLKNQCADILIVVDVGTPSLKPGAIRSVLDVVAQATNIGVQQNVRQQMRYLDKRDIFIRPDLGNYTSASFSASPQLAELGRKAIRQHAEALSALSLDEDGYRAWQQRHQQVEERQPEVSRITVAETRYVSPEALRQPLERLEGRPLDTGELHRTLREAYASGDYERLNYGLRDEADGRVAIDVQAEDRSIAPNYLRFGMTFASETSGESTFNLNFGYTRRWLNAAGAEWRNVVRFGQKDAFGTEWYQPLSVGNPWFGYAGAGYSQRPFTLFNQEGEQIARFDISSPRLSVGGGRSLGNYGEVRVGLTHGHDETRLSLGDPGVFGREGRRNPVGGIEASLVVDQFDSPRLPRSGYLATLHAYQGIRGLGDDDETRRLLMSLDKAYPFDANTVLRVTFKGSALLQSDSLQVDEFSTLGGFLNLSGYKADQLVGEKVALVRLTGYRRVASLPSALGSGLYLGGSLEAGRVWGVPDGYAQKTGWIPAGSLFAAADSLLGPLFLGVGYAEGGKLTAYLTLGMDY